MIRAEILVPHNAVDDIQEALQKVWVPNMQNSKGPESPSPERGSVTEPAWASEHLAKAAAFGDAITPDIVNSVRELLVKRFAERNLTASELGGIADHLLKLLSPEDEEQATDDED